MPSIQLKLNISPSLDAAQLAKQMNVLIQSMKGSLGQFGKDLNIIDTAKLQKDFDKVSASFAQTTKSASGLPSQIDQVTKSTERGASAAGVFTKAFQFNQIVQGLQAVTGAFAPFVTEYVEFDKQIKNIGTLGREDFQEFGGLLTQLAADIPGTAADMANAAYQAISAGAKGTAEEITAFVEIAAKAGVAGMSDTSTAVDGLTSVLNAYNLESSEATAVADTFFAGIKLGKTSFDELNSSLAAFVPSASAMGVSFDQSVAAISRYTALGTPTAQASTQMNAALTLLQKGTAPLNKALEANGTSLEELRDRLKLPVEQGGGLINVFKEIKDSADASGQQLATLTGRVEAAKIIESLAGDTEKAAASLQTFADVEAEIAGNAAQGAFEVASQSISAQTDGMLATVQGYFNSFFTTIGDGGTATLNTLTQLSPAITGVAGAMSILPFGSIASGAKKFAVSVIGSVIPSLVTTTGASGTAAISFRAMWAAMTGPIGLIIGGIAAIGTGLYFLIDAINESTEEKLEQNKAEQEYIDKQIESNKAAQGAIERNEQLVKKYDELSQKTNLSASEQELLNKTIVDLSKAYPGAIDATKSYEENIKTLNVAVGESKEELGGLQTEMEDLQTKANQLELKELELNVELTSESITDQLDDEITGSVIVDGRRIDSDKMIEDYVNSINDATNSQEVSKAVTEFSSALYSSDAFGDVPPEVKAQVLGEIQKLGDERSAIIDKQNEINKANADKAIQELIENQKIDPSFEITDQQITDIANKFDQIPEELIKSTRKSEDALRDARLGEILGESVELQDDLDKNGKIDELIEKFNNAGNEVQKAFIGDKLKELAPEAVKITGRMVDSNGDFINSYEVLNDKIKESADANKERLSSELLSNQEEFVNAIDEEGDGYLDNKARLEQLKSEINKQAALGLDTSELEQEFDKISSENKAISNDIIGIGAKWVESGADATLVIEELAKEMGIPVEEAERLVKETITAKEKIDETAESAQGLGDAFNEALKASQQSYNENVNALAELYRQRDEARKAGDDAEIQAINEKIKLQEETVDNTFDEYKLNKSFIEDAKKRNEQEKKVTKERKSQFEISQAQFNSLKKNLDLKSEEYNIAFEHNLILQDREKTTADEILLQRKKIENLREEQRLLEESFSIIKDEEGNIEFGINIKKEEEEKLRNQYTQLQNKISSEENAEARLNIKAEAETREFEENIEAKVKELERKQLEFNIKLGLANKEDLLDEVNIELDDLQRDIVTTETRKAEILEILPADRSEAENIELKELSEHLLTLQDEELSKRGEINSIIDDIYSDRFDKIKNKNDAELKAVEERVNKEKDLRNILIDSSLNAFSRDLTNDFKGQIDDLEAAREAELISEEFYNKKKLELQEKHNAEIAAAQAVAEGERLEAERQLQVALAEERKKELESEIEHQIKLIAAKGDNASQEEKERLVELRDELGNLARDFNSRQEQIVFYANQLSENLGQTFANVGNPEEMREGFRKMFGTIAGALKAQASALITQKILEQLALTPGGVYSLLLTPVIHGLVSAGVNALLNPILNSLLSFSTGGRVDEPTVAVIGDASKSRPGPDTEWILRDDQIRWIVDSTLEKHSNKLQYLFGDVADKISNVLTNKIDKNRNELIKSSSSTKDVEISNISEINKIVNKSLTELKIYDKETRKSILKQIIVDEVKSVRSSMVDQISNSQFELFKSYSKINKFEYKKLEESSKADNINLEILKLTGIIDKLSKNIEQLRPQYEAKDFTIKNIISDSQKIIELRSLNQDYRQELITKDEYNKLLNQKVKTIKVNSYATGSPFLNSPELAIVGDAGKNNPEIVLNRPQIEALISAQHQKTVEYLGPRLDRQNQLLEIIASKPILTSKNVADAYKYETAKSNKKIVAGTKS